MIASGIRRLRSNKNKIAFGRPVKQRYSNRFYAKQQLRFFHGELKNIFFKNFFKRHIKSTVIRSKSFFSELESRADRVFFRRRILPTIFACRQFIYHKGIEINSIAQNSPRYIVRTGDIISLSPNVWKAMYDNFFQRIYYRR
jgi:ribosomal protein S4